MSLRTSLAFVLTIVVVQAFAQAQGGAQKKVEIVRPVGTQYAWSMKFGPGAKQLITNSGDFRIWDVTSSKLIRSVKSKGQSVVFNETGTLFATYGRTYMNGLDYDEVNVDVTEVATGKQVYSFKDSVSKMYEIRDIPYSLVGGKFVGNEFFIVHQKEEGIEVVNTATNVRHTIHLDDLDVEHTKADPKSFSYNLFPVPIFQRTFTYWEKSFLLFVDLSTATVKYFYALPVNHGNVHMGTGDGRFVVVSDSATIICQTKDGSVVKSLINVLNVGDPLVSGGDHRLVTFSSDSLGKPYASVWSKDYDRIQTKLKGISLGDLSSDGRWFAGTTDDGRVKIWDMHSGKSNQLATFGSTPENVWLDESNDWILMEGDSSVLRFSYTTGKVKTFKGNAYRVRNDLKLMATYNRIRSHDSVTSRTGVNIYDYKTGELVKSLPEVITTADPIYWYGDVFLAGENVYNLEGKLVRSIDEKKQFLTTDGKLIVTYESKGTTINDILSDKQLYFFEGYAPVSRDGKLVVLPGKKIADVATGKLLIDFSDYGSFRGFSNDSRIFWTSRDYNIDEIEVHFLNPYVDDHAGPVTFKALDLSKMPSSMYGGVATPQHINYVDFSSDNKVAYVEVSYEGIVDQSSLVGLAWEKPDTTARLNIPSYVDDKVAFASLQSRGLKIPNGQFGFLRKDDNVVGMVDEGGSGIVFANVVTGETLFTLSLVGERDWVITHPSGLFDASAGAMQKLYFVQGLDLIDFGQLKARYYEPGLWSKIIAGEKLRDVVGFKSIALPPDISVGLVNEKGILPIEIINRGGGIGEVAIFLFGKELTSDARGKKPNPDAPSLKINYYVGNLKGLVKGENIIRVKAWNKEHWVVSRPAVVYYNTTGTEHYDPAIHILSIGVSDYTGSEIDLKYAAKDAGDVSKALQLGGQRLFGTSRSYVYSLNTDLPVESWPTKKNIIKTFEKIAASAHPLDVVVVYLSGHGVNAGRDGDWYYLTQEAYTASEVAYKDPSILKQTTLSSSELAEIFNKLPASKQVLMIDACASGKVVENLMAKKDVPSSTLRALDRMRDRTGMHIITGCTADAVSYEASRYGQGVLTYSLLEGIRGGALRENEFVDVNRLFQYAHDRVPALALGIGGVQTPMIFSPEGSQSFDIGQLTSDDAKAVPIAKVRPVYIRSNFQDENELEDVLGLGKKVDGILNDASSKGTEAPFIFVDVREYPEGCKLNGLYKTENGKVVLKLKKRCEGKETLTTITGADVEDLSKGIVRILEE